MKIGILREGKVPPDKRAPFTPLQVEEIIQLYPETTVFVQRSPHRCFREEEFEEFGAASTEDVSMCDLLLGVKEVPVQDLIPGKTYLFFSHTIKKQPYNRKLLQEILRQKIWLIDYEALKDKQGNRLVAFGRYAGLVGAYNALWTYSKRFGGFSLKRAFECFDVNELKLEVRKVSLPPIKIILTGAGRVGKGAMESLDSAGIRKVSPRDFLQGGYDEPVYVQLHSADYHTRKEGGHFNREEFHKNPEKYSSHFRDFTRIADLLIAGAYWNPKAPALFTREDMLHKDFRIKVIADVTCDIEGSVPSTKRASSIAEPVYDYDPATDRVMPPFSDPRHVSVMAIDNLPCELPRSATEEFGRDMIDRIMGPLLRSDPDGIIGRATIARDGSLTPAFAYLKDYVEGR
jgi:alanine dehydrogenase